MRAVVQRVKKASVSVDGQVTGAIGEGFLVLFGVGEGDGDEDLAYITKKILGLRIFDDEDGRMNRSLLDVGGAILAVSQFTLYGDVRHGMRPSFITAAAPDRGELYFERFKKSLSDAKIPVASGIFGADMQVELINDGPVTILLDSKKQF